MTERHVPQGDVSKRSDGSYTVRTKTGDQYSMRPNGSVSSFQGRDRGEAQFRQDGSVKSVRARDMTILHGPLGGHQIIRERPDHTVIVARGAGHGYIQRTFSSRDHEFAMRTYYGNRGPFNRFYQPYHYRGFALYTYVPILYYPPVFYDWVYSPWAFGVHFRWGWLSASWYPYYGPYFTPYAVYPGAPFWLTDYFLATALEEDYRERMDAAAAEASAFAPPRAQVRLSAEVKQAIADEVRLQLSLENQAGQTVARNDLPDPAATGLERLLSDNRPHVFVVSASLEVLRGNEECILTPGDVLQLTGPPPANSSYAYLKVLASKGQGCSVGSIVAVSLQDLQDMLNYMRETIDQGLAELQSRQGQDGLPAAPAAALGSKVQAPFATAAPPPDPDGAALLSQVVNEAGAAEQEVLDQAFQQSAPVPRPETSLNPSFAEPSTLRVGQTVDEVIAILGGPTTIVDLGAKKIYIYPGLKITFTSGRVTDVQ